MNEFRFDEEINEPGTDELGELERVLDLPVEEIVKDIEWARMAASGLL